MTEVLTQTHYTKARVVEDPPEAMIRRWLNAGVSDFKDHMNTSLGYGLALFVIGWFVLLLLFRTHLSWMVLPALAGGLLIGPIATVGLYRVSRRGQGKGGGGIAAPGQIFLAGVILMVFMMAWVRAATLIFAVFYGLKPFSGFWETMTTMLSSWEGLAVILIGSLVGGLFAALGFAISVFSIPMLVDRDIDCFSAMGLSFNATTHNFQLMVRWAAVVTALVGVGVLTGLLGLVVIFPVLGFATWHAYCDLFQGDAS